MLVEDFLWGIALAGSAVTYLLLLGLILAVLRGEGSPDGLDDLEDNLDDTDADD